MKHLPLPRRSLLLTVVAIAAVVAVGCQSFLGLDATEQALVASTPTSESSPTPVPTATTTPMPPTPTEPNATSDLSSEPFEGSLAPDLTLPDLKGHEVSLRGLKGKVVLLNFWASW
jgi:thiol-disulfide isomerase/thioredoxin